MNKLYQYSKSRINTVDTGFKRYLWNEINWKNRLIVITGARGVGKTTFLLQYIKENFGSSNDDVIFVSLDDLYFSKNSLVDFTDSFVKQGGKYLFLDEVNKYTGWSQEVKNIYDYFDDLKIIITGSSALDIYKGKADLSRRAALYKMKGLSFREFIQMKYKIHLPVLKLNDILSNSSAYIPDILKKIKPIKMFQEYLQTGYYPFFMEDEQGFHNRLKETVNHILDNDLPSVERIDFIAIHHLRKLLSILSEIVPYKPNILKLSRQVGVSRETLLKYLYLLTKADLLMLLTTDSYGISKMNKPEKIYMNNPNLIYALTGSMVNEGTIRETFFFNQLEQGFKITYTATGDFLVDNRITFEIGGKNKTGKQIRGIKNAYIAADNIEFPHQNSIPLWLFGFLY